MSRRQELCRDFQRGNCRFGARCKFLHELPLQQQQQQQQQQRQPQQQQRYQQQRNQFGGGGNYYHVLGDNSKNSNQRQQQSQNNASKEHRCNDPRACKEQIKEDMANEHPLFWRLTCYAHYKFLPNDIVGDVSPEELRALAYEGAKQGLSLKDVVQREQSMVAAKSAEFDALLRTPYKGRAQTSSGLQSSSFTSSPFLAPGKTSTFVPFGQPANISAVGPPQVFAQIPFGGTPTTSFNFSQPSGDVQFGKQQANVSIASPSHFRQPTNVFQQSPFGVTSSSVPQSPFGGTISPGSLSPLPNLQGPNMAFNNTAFQSPFGSVTQAASPLIQSVPAMGSFLPTMGSPAAFAPPGPTPVPNTPAPIPQTPRGTPLQVAPMTTQDNAIWMKDIWKIGEIPEGEPPPEGLSGGTPQPDESESGKIIARALDHWRKLG